MRDKIIRFSKEKIADLADKYFQRICGDSIEGEQKEVFLAEIRKAKEYVLCHMNPMAVCSYYGINGKRQPAACCGEVRLSDDEAFFLKGEGRSSHAGPQEARFQGGIFRYYGQFPVNGILTYLLTIGDLHKNEEMKLLQQYYIDAWGSAYVEGAHDLLKADLQKNFCHQPDWQEGQEKSRGNSRGKRNWFVSEPFGPGYFGIAVEDTKLLFQISAYEALNLSLSQGGMMRPEKSCSGFYVIAEGDIPFPEDHCASCIAKRNCEYCRKKYV